VESVAREVALRKASLYAAPLTSVYLGGGTPSHLGGEGIDALLTMLKAQFVLADDAEVTLEANPEDVSQHSVRHWRKAGVNRVSLGVQTLSDEALRWMHRVHNAHLVRLALSAIGDEFENYSVDLIFALPPSVPRNVDRDMAELLSFSPAHISIYGLTAEPRSPFFRWLARGDCAEATEERYEHEYLAIHRRLVGAGYSHYEVSNFAREGRRSVHNSAYWSGASYIGLGPSAHGFDGETRRWNTASFADWTARVHAGRDPIDGSELLTLENRVAEEVYLGLRVRTGLAISEAELPLVSPWIASGWGSIDSGRLRLTTLGWLRMDSLASSLTASRSRY
jgi:oxygen-independent coproporphyrinogen-3 oxidase